MNSSFHGIKNPLLIFGFLLKLDQCEFNLNKHFLTYQYLNNIIEQDHRMLKWWIVQGLGFEVMSKYPLSVLLKGWQKLFIRQ